MNHRVVIADGAMGAMLQGRELSLGEDFLDLVPKPAIATRLAAAITHLLSNDGTNVNGAILASDSGWSAI